MTLHRVLISLTVVAAVGCGVDENAVKLADAQACMNEATPQTASTCMSKLDGATGDRAALMRCSIKFIEEGFDQSDRLVQVAGAMSASGGSSDPTLSAMAFLAFQASSDSETNRENAAQAEELCAKTSAPGYIMLSSFANIATNFLRVSADVGLDLSSGEPPSQQEMEAIATYLATNPTDPGAIAVATAVGGTVLSTYESSCQGGSTDAFCSDLSAAMSEAADPTDPASIGAALIAHLQSAP